LPGPSQDHEHLERARLAPTSPIWKKTVVLRLVNRHKRSVTFDCGWKRILDSSRQRVLGEIRAGEERQMAAYAMKRGGRVSIFPQGDR